MVFGLINIVLYQYLRQNCVLNCLLSADCLPRQVLLVDTMD